MIQQKGHKKKTEPQPEKWESWATSWKSQSAVPTCTLLTVPFLPLASAQIHNLHSLFPIGDVLIHMTSLRKRRRRKGISVSNVTSFAFYSPQIKCSKEFLQIAHYTFDVNWSFRGPLCSSQSSLLTSPAHEVYRLNSVLLPTSFSLPRPLRSKTNLLSRFCSCLSFPVKLFLTTPAHSFCFKYLSYSFVYSSGPHSVVGAEGTAGNKENKYKICSVVDACWGENKTNWAGRVLCFYLSLLSLFQHSMFISHFCNWIVIPLRNNIMSSTER